MAVGAVVVLGASVAGATAAATLRERGHDGPIALLGDEQLPPYERPPMSKEYLRGEQPFERALVRDPDWYEEHGIEIRLGVRAERLDLAEPARAVVLAGGERVPFDRAVIATGARNRRPAAIPGLDLPGVLDLRTPADADAIREAAGGGARVAVVGMGFIGSEVAASLRSLGADVTAVDVFDVPLQRALGREVGAVMGAIHRDHGVELVMGDAVARLEGGSRVGAVVTASGRSISCDVAVIGLGVQPNVEPALASGLAVDDGVLVGPTMEASAPGVFAVGDVARHEHPLFGPIRVEHYDNAIKMGEAVAGAVLGDPTVHEDPHWFWSDQYDVNLQVAGIPGRDEETVLRGSVEARSFVRFELAGRRLMAAIGLDRGRDVRRALKLIGRPVDPAVLRDEDVDLRTLAALPEE
jgi:3-phenylpropionate/trans-cinnamate dioxygenase ferredoxin reductase component